MRTLGIIPAYNESATIGPVIDGVFPHVDDVVVVDDCSSDDTRSIASEHGATVIPHAINVGVGGALRTGYRYALEREYDVIVQIDGDGQHDPQYLPVLLDAIEDNDIVVGSRYLNASIDDYSLVRRLGIRCFATTVNVFGNTDIADVTSGYRVYRAEKLAEIVHHSDKHWAVEQTLEAGNRGLQLEEVSVAMPTRTEGESQFDLATLLMYPVRMTDIILRILVFR